MAIKNPLIIGLGGVGNLLAVMLKEQGMQVTALDRQQPAHLPEGVQFVSGDVQDGKALSATLEKYDAVISCLPYNLSLAVAEAAYKVRVPYFDPTEDVKTTEAVRKLAQSAPKTMIPQCGLAPGAIGIIGAHLAAKFDAGTLRYLKLRVGALPQSPTGQLGYAGNWSLAGLVHEYIADCDLIADGKRQKIAPLRNEEILRIRARQISARAHPQDHNRVHHLCRGRRVEGKLDAGSAIPRRQGQEHGAVPPGGQAGDPVPRQFEDRRTGHAL